MPPSMRAQRKREAKRTEEAKKKSDARKEAVELLRRGSTSIRSVSSATGVPKSTVGLLNSCLRQNDSEKLHQLLKADLSHGQSVLSKVEETMLVERINFAANRGFAMDEEVLKCMMARFHQMEGKLGSTVFRVMPQFEHFVPAPLTYPSVCKDLAKVDTLLQLSLFLLPV